MTHDQKIASDRSTRQDRGKRNGDTKENQSGDGAGCGHVDIPVDVIVLNYYGTVHKKEALLNEYLLTYPANQIYY